MNCHPCDRFSTGLAYLETGIMLPLPCAEGGAERAVCLRLVTDGRSHTALRALTVKLKQGAVISKMPLSSILLSKRQLKNISMRCDLG